ncbi:hypothetical protein HJ590_09620 [Naumannella sp. ID2617S]|nr:hypothetical protein [Naumannella sp. ID2617S]
MTPKSRTIWANFSTGHCSGTGDDRLLDPDQAYADDLAGYVWAVAWQELYPGCTLLPPDEETRRWSEALGLEFRRVRIEANAHVIELVFADLEVSEIEAR